MFGGSSRAATSIVAGDKIQVSLAYTKPDGQRVAVQNRFDSNGEAIDQFDQFTGGQGLDIGGTGSGEGAPEFNQSAYNALLSQGKRDAARAMKTQYEIDLAVFETEGGVTNASDAVRNAVLEFCKQVHGVSTTDNRNGPVIKPEQIIVKAPLRNASGANAGIWAVQLAPSWGR